MRGFCAIDVNPDATFISISSSNRGNFKLTDEVDITLSCTDNDLVNFLKNNFEILNKTICEKEKRSNLKIDKIFINLPRGEEKSVIAEGLINLDRYKKITPQDITLAKNNIEKSFLNWDDLCLHHLILRYTADDVVYAKPPLGVWANKLKLKSYLFSVKEKVYKDTEDILYNFSRVFGGFVISGISEYSSSFTQRVTIPVVMVNIGYDLSYVSLFMQGEIKFTKGIDFGLKKIIEALAQKFSLEFSVAYDLYLRYVSFAKILTNIEYQDKEVTIKNKQTYFSVSMNAVNSCVIDNTRLGVNQIIENILASFGVSDCAISFITRFNKKEGFFDFINTILPKTMNNILPLAEVASPAYGCLRYGIMAFFENDYKKQSLLKRILGVYQDYF